MYIHGVQRRGIGDDLQATVLAELVLPLVSTIVVSLRLYARVAFKYNLKWDDFTIVASLLFAWVLWALWYYCSVSIVQGTISTMPLTRYPDFLKLAFAQEFVYVNGCNVVKISILFFYLRALGTTRRLRIGIYILFGFVGAYAATRFFTTLFECTPTSYFWDRTQNGKCLDFYSLLLTLQIFNVLTDFAVLLFPVPIVLKLQMPLRRKIGLCAAFTFGTVACAGSAVRIWLVIVVFGGDSTSLFLDDVAPKLVLCALVELCIGIIAASLPALRAPVWEFIRKRRAKPAISDSNPSSSSKQTTPAATKLPVTSVVSVSPTMTESPSTSQPPTTMHATAITTRVKPVVKVNTIGIQNTGAEINTDDNWSPQTPRVEFNSIMRSLA